MTSPRTFGWASASAQRCSLPARTSPPRTSSGSVVAAATARMSSVAGIFSHVYALVDPRPDATWIERTTASVDRSLRSRGFGPRGAGEDRDGGAVLQRAHQ